MSTPDPSEPFISSFPENNTVGIVWMLFWVFWGSLVCLYVPLCFCPVPYDGTYVPSKDGEAVKVGVRVQKQADRQKVKELLNHMACTAEEHKKGCPSNTITKNIHKQKIGDNKTTFKQYAQSLLNDNEGDVKKAKEAWKKSPERQLLEMKVEKSDLLDQLNNRIATAAAQNTVSNAAHTARQARRQQRGSV
jgi:hypothetical protein